ncbi:hypothetical protein [Pseudoduganella namucuonensis]|uniref:hypothetical protein n=1 Tax=Pseudoduganella namucuonensis TaxID=1035707 RepID=UPI001160684D|nr:hypothetical protein [Pseudoduganella namucuonensis]
MDLAIATMGFAGFEDLGSLVQAVTVVRRAELNDAHWELFLECNGTLIKVDLTMHGYRVLYGAALPVGGAITSERIVLDTPKSLGIVLRAVSDVALAKGQWTGTQAYNCQDFAIALMLEMRMSTRRIFPFELRRAVTKRNGRLGLPGIGDGM